MTPRTQCRPSAVLTLCLIFISMSLTFANSYANNTKKKLEKTAMAKLNPSGNNQGKKIQDRISGPGVPCTGPCAELVAETLLKAAKDFYVAGQREMGRHYITELIRRFPGTKAALTAKYFKPLDQSGRVGFITSTTGFGVALGILVPLSFEVREPTIVGLSLLAFTGVSLMTSLLVTRNIAMSSGQASLTVTGTLWGAWNFGALALLTDMRENNILKMFALGSIAGYATGVLLGRYLPLRQGQVTFASTVGLWTTAYTGMLVGVLLVNGARITPTAAIASLLVASDVGLIGGAFLHSKTLFSNSRTLLTNLSWLVGGVLGAGVLLLAGNSPDATGGILTIMGTSAAGLGLGIFLTRNMAPARRDTYIADNGALLQLHKGKWHTRVPMPSVVPRPDLPQGEIPLAVNVPIAAGTW